MNHKTAQQGAQQQSRDEDDGSFLIARKLTARRIKAGLDDRPQSALDALLKMTLWKVPDDVTNEAERRKLEGRLMTARASTEGIMARSGITDRRTLRKALNALVSAGIVRVIEPAKPTQAARYGFADTSRDPHPKAYLDEATEAVKATERTRRNWRKPDCADGARDPLMIPATDPTVIPANDAVRDHRETTSGINSVPVRDHQVIPSVTLGETLVVTSQKETSPPAPPSTPDGADSFRLEGVASPTSKTRKASKPKRDPDAPPSLRTMEVLALVAECAGVRFALPEARDLTQGHHIAIANLVKRYPTSDEWRALGEWIGAGGDAWRGAITVPQLVSVTTGVMPTVRRWVADGRPAIATKPGATKVPAKPVPDFSDTSDPFAAPPPPTLGAVDARPKLSIVGGVR